jgi:hypothetical protein
MMICTLKDSRIAEKPPHLEEERRRRLTTRTDELDGHAEPPSTSNHNDLKDSGEEKAEVRERLATQRMHRHEFERMQYAIEGLTWATLSRHWE